MRRMITGKDAELFKNVVANGTKTEVGGELEVDGALTVNTYHKELTIGISDRIEAEDFGELVSGKHYWISYEDEDISNYRGMLAQLDTFGPEDGIFFITPIGTIYIETNAIFDDDEIVAINMAGMQVNDEAVNVSTLTIQGLF